MKIVKEEQGLMVLKDRNITVFVFGIIFTLAGFLVIIKPDFFTNRPPMWSGFVGILIGLFIIFAAKITTVTLNKISRKIALKRKNLINEKFQEYDIGSVKQLKLQQVYVPNSKGGGGHSYKLAFVLDGGEEVLLNPYGSSIIKVMGRQVITEKKIGARIANFLNIPFQERRSLTVSETLSTVQSAIQDVARKEMEKQKKE